MPVCASDHLDMPSPKVRVLPVLLKKRRPQQGSSPMSILILEDNLDKVVQIVLKERALFEHRSFELVRDVPTAVARYYAGAPDFIFVDHDLGPGLDTGDVFLQRIIDDPLAVGTVFYLSSLSKDRRREMAQILKAKGLTFKEYRGYGESIE